MNGNLFPKNNKSIEIYRGDTLQIIFENIPDIDTGIVTVEFQIRVKSGSELLLQKTVISTDPANDWPNGVVAVNLTPGQTQGLTPDFLYRYDLRITRDGVVNADYYGNCYLVGDISGTGTIVASVAVSDIYSNLASNDSNKGASLIGVLSSFWNTLFSPLTVENALQWLFNNRLKKIFPFTGNKILQSDSIDDTIVVETGISISGNNISGIEDIDISGNYLLNGNQLDTDNVPEGSINRYYSDALFDSSLATKDTDDLSEGSTNKYFTETRVLDYLKAILSSNGSIIYRDGSGNIVQRNIGSTGEVLTVSGGLPIWSAMPSAIENFAIGSIQPIIDFYGPTLPANWKWCDGSLVSDVDSPIDAKRVPNLNGATVSSVSIISFDNTAKTITISTNDIFAFSIGDTLTITGATVPNAIVKAINYSTGIITIGDSTTWSTGSFDATTANLTGATAISSVGVPRYLKGSNAVGSNIDTFQGHRHNPLSPQTSIFGVIVGDSFGVTAGTNYGFASTTGGPVTDGTNGTPRSAQRTEPPAINVKWAIKFK